MLSRRKPRSPLTVVLVMRARTALPQLIRSVQQLDVLPTVAAAVPLLGAGPATLVDALPRTLVPAQVVLAGARDLDRGEAAFVSNAAVSLLSPADVIVPDRVAGAMAPQPASRAATTVQAGRGASIARP